MGIPKIVQELLDKKAEMSNTIDLDTYAIGLLDMYRTLQLQQTFANRCFEFSEWIAKNYVRLNGVWVHKYHDQRNPDNYITTEELYNFWLTVI